MKWIYKSKSTILIMLKTLIFLTFCVVFSVISYENYQFTKFFSINLGTSTFTFGLLFLLFNYIYGGFKFGENRISDVVYSLNLSSILSLILTYLQLCILFKLFLSFIPIIIIIISNISLSLISSICFSSIYNKLYPPKKTAIIYSAKTNLDAILKKINSRPDKYSLCKIISSEQNIKQLSSDIKNIQLVILCDLEHEYRKQIIKYCYKNNIEIRFIPTIVDIMINNASFYPIIDIPLFQCNYKSLSLEQQIIKRIFDIFFCSIMFILLTPIMLITAIAIKLYDKGPIFIVQNRVTINNKVFKLYKFRSMITNAEKDGIARLASKNDNRITPIGKIIRMLRIDEIPQLINVLKGDMSIVGPRPERPEIIKQYILELSEYEYRTKVKAGLTGFAQIKGKYNTTPIDKLIMDLMYIESYSLLLDLKLIFMTIKIIFLPESTEGI